MCATQTNNSTMARGERQVRGTGVTHLNRSVCSSVFSLLGAAALREPLEEERWRLEVPVAAAPALPPLAL